VAEADGSRSVGLLIRDVPWAAGEAPSHCRAFLIEPEVRPQLVTALQRAGVEWPGDLLAAAFDPENIAGGRDLSRLLAAIPDLDAESAALAGPALRFARRPVMEYLERFPPRPHSLTVVLACEPPLDALA
jgi:hypothetical protein